MSLPVLITYVRQWWKEEERKKEDKGTKEEKGKRMKKIAHLWNVHCFYGT
jgi:hypothetical protein